ncbi:uncharacterized protein LOC112968567 [Apteryx rowi]|uniref:uncharacterized protein LOC112968567 n=1 Tax=Apteryx rowi TaxID=308060 RepID=UPI000E1C5763|nr:uncharacterized protein LOC112968567 [Apteryx rowi]
MAGASSGARPHQLRSHPADGTMPWRHQRSPWLLLSERVQVTRHQRTRDRHLLLFSDAIARFRCGSTFLLKQRVPLSDLWVLCGKDETVCSCEDEEDVFGLKCANSLVLVWTTKVCVVTFRSQEAKPRSPGDPGQLPALPSAPCQGRRLRCSLGVADCPQHGGLDCGRGEWGLPLPRPWLGAGGRHRSFGRARGRARSPAEHWSVAAAWGHSCSPASPPQECDDLGSSLQLLTALCVPEAAPEAPEHTGSSAAHPGAALEDASALHSPEAEAACGPPTAETQQPRGRSPSGRCRNASCVSAPPLPAQSKQLGTLRRSLSEAALSFPGHWRGCRRRQRGTSWAHSVADGQQQLGMEKEALEKPPAMEAAPLSAGSAPAPSSRCSLESCRAASQGPSISLLGAAAIPACCLRAARAARKRRRRRRRQRRKRRRRERRRKRETKRRRKRRRSLT